MRSRFELIAALQRQSLPPADVNLRQVAEAQARMEKAGEEAEKQYLAAARAVEAERGRRRRELAEARAAALELEDLRRGNDVRAGALVGLKLAADESGDIRGYGARFNNTDSYGDVIVPGAFRKTLAEHARKGRTVPLLWSHDVSQPIGVWRTLREDQDGLFVEGVILREVQRGAEALALLDAEAITGLSIGFSIKPGGAEYDRQAGVRRLTDLELFEVSLVAFPANDAARVEG